MPQACVLLSYGETDRRWWLELLICFVNISISPASDEYFVVVEASYFDVWCSEGNWVFPIVAQLWDAQQVVFQISYPTDILDADASIQLYSSYPLHFALFSPSEGDCTTFL